MIDFEVERLRRLRGSALRLRSLARALSHKQWSRDDALLNQGRCAAWRLARTVSGRLRAHPYPLYQKDAGLGLVLSNCLFAAVTAVSATSRHRALCVFSDQLKSLMRELDDARALTRAADMSDSFGRSQRELRALLASLHFETHSSAPAPAPAPSARASRSSGSSPRLADPAPVHDASPFLTI